MKSGSDTPADSTLLASGADILPSVEVFSYSLEIRDDEGFIGDKARKGAFGEIIDRLRDEMGSVGDDPLGGKATKKFATKDFDKVLAKGDAPAAGLIHSAIEEFAQRLADVLRRFLTEPEWEGTERVVLGGGMRDSRVGELIAGRVSTILKSEGIGVDIVPVAHDPDHAGLIGGAYLVPRERLTGFDAMLAVDIGGSNIRAGILELPQKRSTLMKKVRVSVLEHWEYGKEAEDPSRTEAVRHLVEVLEMLAEKAEEDGQKLAPVIAIACPGRIDADGNILAGGQNLPGNWESDGFNLPRAIIDGVPEIGGEPTQIVMHNDAVVQGLSEVPDMADVERWGVVTIGTGLGNASFRNRRQSSDVTK